MPELFATRKPAPHVEGHPAWCQVI